MFIQQISRVAIVLSLTFMMGMVYTTSAQDINLSETIKNDLAGERHYALLAKKKNHIKGAYKTFQQMKAAGIDIESFEVVAIGPAVQSLKQESDFANFLDSSIQGNAFEINACAMAMKKFEVAEEHLHKKIGIVPNGFVRIYQLQAQDHLIVQP